MRPLIVVAGDVLVDVDICATATRVTDDGLPVLAGFDSWTSQFGTKIDYAAFANETHVSLGGAAAVARMAYGLGADVLLLGNSLAAHNRKGVWRDLYQPATDETPNSIWSLSIAPYAEPSVKRRLLVDGKPVLRIDQDNRVPLTELAKATQGRIRARLNDRPEGQPVYLILSDYAKGILDEPRAIRDLVATVNPVELFVDPHSSRETPDLHFGACDVMTFPWNDLKVRNSVKHLLLKRGPEGMRLVDTRQGGESVACHPSDFGFFRCDLKDRPLDTCGCGDMAIAALAVARGEGASWEHATCFATAAAAEKTLVRGANPVPRSVVDARFNIAGSPS